MEPFEENSVPDMFNGINFCGGKEIFRNDRGAIYTIWPTETVISRKISKKMQEKKGDNDFKRSQVCFSPDFPPVFADRA